MKALYEAGIAKDMKNAAPTFNAAFERACTNRYAAVAYRILLDPSLVTCNLARLKIPLLVNPWTMGLPTHSEYSGIFTKRYESVYLIDLTIHSYLQLFLF